MTDTELKKLLSRAQNASQEPWTTDEKEHDAPYQPVKIRSGYHSVCTLWFDDAPVRDFNSQQAANVKFLIAAQPKKLVEVLETVKLLREELDAAHMAMCQHLADFGDKSGSLWKAAEKAGKALEPFK